MSNFSWNETIQKLENEEKRKESGMFQAIEQMMSMQKERYYGEYNGMKKMYNMLSDFDEDNWNDLKDSGATEEWLNQYLQD